MARLALPNRLRHWRNKKGLSRSKLAELAKTSHGQIQKLENGERKLTQQWMERLAPHLGVVPAQLLPPTADELKAEAQDRRERQLLEAHVQDFGEIKAVVFGGESYWAIGVFDIRASAGPGAVNEDGAPLHFNLFRSEYIRRITTASPRDLAVVRVAGDSMWDTLHDGDHVLTDLSIRIIGRDAIYVIRLGGELQIKRVSRHPGTKLLTVKSDNPAYPTYADITPADLDVVGRVIWLGRNIGG
jgi:phage repressor protein C with HTH and peptisase S24 domain